MSTPPGSDSVYPASASHWPDEDDESGSGAQDSAMSVTSSQAALIDDKQSVRPIRLTQLRLCP